ncbi:hypothetical protein [Hymenobacter mucosus]|uniref:Uncharacterized protein n=1 Tax=Hymenobacter mucosus TaxID=1411120 RepID=A0A239ARV0_9BACT|nr:hypothetical protein [Hymenobacter mucosus]SNR98425.1 hypothetical protein SAMN06269173_1159 [Hymenobacter mucosus]
MKNRFAFTKYRLIGYSVRVVHQIGACAVAKIGEGGNLWPFYAIRFRNQYAEAHRNDHLPAAFAALRQLDNAYQEREGDMLNSNDAVQQLSLDAACFAAFCAATGLQQSKSYTRREVREAIVAAKLRRLPGRPSYLSLLNKLAPPTTTV